MRPERRGVPVSCRGHPGIILGATEQPTHSGGAVPVLTFRATRDSVITPTRQSAWNLYFGCLVRFGQPNVSVPFARDVALLVWDPLHSSF